MHDLRRLSVHPDHGAIHTLFGVPAGERDTLFTRLDGQWIHGQRARWRTEVMSITFDGTVTWVQIGSADDPVTSVVLRMRDGQRADLALTALREWADLPEDRRTTFASRWRDWLQTAARDRRSA